MLERREFRFNELFVKFLRKIGFLWAVRSTRFWWNFTGPVIKFYLPPRAQTFHSFPQPSTTTFAHRPRFLSYLVATFLLLTFRKNFSECNYAVHPLIGQHISPKQREFFRIIKFRSSAYRWQANKKNARDGKIRIENETIKITREFNIRIIWSCKNSFTNFFQFFEKRKTNRSKFSFSDYSSFFDYPLLEQITSYNENKQKESKRNES